MRYDELVEVKFDNESSTNDEYRFTYVVEFEHPKIPNYEITAWPRGKKGSSKVHISIGILDANSVIDTIPRNTIFNFGYTLYEYSYTPTGRFRNHYWYRDGGTDKSRIRNNFTPTMRETIKQNLYAATKDVLTRLNVETLIRGPLTPIKTTLPRYQEISKIISSKYPVFDEVEGTHGTIWIHSKTPINTKLKERLKGWKL